MYKPIYVFQILTELEWSRKSTIFNSKNINNTIIDKLTFYEM